MEKRNSAGTNKVVWEREKHSLKNGQGMEVKDVKTNREEKKLEKETTVESIP